MGNFETPVVVMAFNRPELTKKLMDILALVRPSTLITICDGPRAEFPEDFERVRQTREHLRDVAWDCDVIEVFAESNMGLRNRFISGLDYVFSKYESAIILEDDCHPDLSFFPFCRELLDKYKSDNRVSMVSGNNFGGSWESEFSYRFSHSTNIWGWATWARTWQSFEEFKYRNSWSRDEIDSIRETFATKGDFRKLAHLMQISQNLDTWDVAFSYSCRIKKLISVVPSKNMVTNLGFGAGSTHTFFESFVDEVAPQSMTFPMAHPTSKQVDWRLERRESRSKAMRWVQYPLAHPLDTTLRVIRYLLLLARRRHQI